MKLSNEERKIHKMLSQKKWRAKNRDRVNEWKRVWHNEHKEEMKKIKREYWRKNKEQLTQKRKEKRVELKTKIIKAYSKEMKCANCGLADLKNLTIDHLNGNGERHRRNSGLSGGYSFYYWLQKKNFPPGYQVLCFGCNMEKGGR